jgi:hypothetical protein
MRIRVVFILAATLAVTSPAESPALAAPTCQDRSGVTTRCGTNGGMPVGWTAPEWDRHFAPADRGLIFKAVAGIVLVLALIALMPDFEGGHWDREEDDDWE